MNTKLTAILTSAVVAGLLSSQVAKAEEAATGATPAVSAEKEGCHHAKEEHKAGDVKKKKKSAKASCKHGCKADHAAEAPAAAAPAAPATEVKK